MTDSATMAKCKAILEMSEKELQDAAIKILKHYPQLVFWPNPSGRAKRCGQWLKYGEPGSPDIIGIMPDGKFVGLEFKTKTGTFRPDQVRFRGKCEDRHALYFVVRDLDDLKPLLTMLEEMEK